MPNPGAFSPLAGDAAAHAAAVAASTTIAPVQTGILTHTTQARTAGIDDAAEYVRFTNAAAVGYTIPPNSAVPIPINAVIEFEQAGAGAVTVIPGAGVTILSRGADLVLAGQYAVAALRKVGTDTWVLTGDL
jgi:hypothetical protein